jgi:hypothetical protein
MKYALFVFLFFFSLAHGQYSEQPIPESNADLRNLFILFKVEIFQDKKVVALERRAGRDYFLRLSYKGQEKIKKIPGQKAQKLDQDFSARFLRCQYEFPATRDKCQVTLRLNMKGEVQEICQKEDLKTQEITSFLSELLQLF